MKRIALLLSLLVLGGCSTLDRMFPPTPWVKPYERDNLADVIMSFDRDPVDSSFMTHGFGNREAAIGAEGSGGGGCGCN